jgi:oligoendopeptidase F
VELDGYRRQAEAFCEQIDREYYLHHSGRKRSFDIEPIYDRHAELFSRRALEELREAARAASGEEARRVRYLLDFAFQGHLGREVKAEATRLAELEAEMVVEADGDAIPYRGVTVALANEADAGRRAELERARDELLSERLNPLHLEMLERVHGLTHDLGWSSYREACTELRGIDLEALAAQAGEFLRETDGVYAEIADPELGRAGVAALGELRRSDLPRFFRAPALEALFPAERAVGAFAETVAGLGIDLERQDNVHLDTETRPTKSSRAFCATPRVPGEIYLVISPTGGRDDFEALFHEGGHVEHYAHVDPDLPIEHRRLGDNSVTESFAFLLEHLTEDPEWLAAALDVEDAAPVVRHARAVKLVMLRRYAAKIAYELDLHDARPDLERMPARYAELLGTTTRVAWRRDSWLADVDPAFYVACYLRAWALETSWRSALRERFGARWFESAEAGEWLRSLWRQGQRLDAHELLAEALGEELDFRVLTREFASAG